MAVLHAKWVYFAHCNPIQDGRRALAERAGQAADEEQQQLLFDLHPRPNQPPRHLTGAAARACWHAHTLTQGTMQARTE